MSVKSTTLHGIVSIELARPEARNALSRELILQLMSAIEAVSGDQSARASSPAKKRNHACVLHGRRVFERSLRV